MEEVRKEIKTGGSALVAHFGFALAIIGLSLDSDRPWLAWILAGVLILFGLLMLLAKVVRRPALKKVVDGIIAVDLTYTAFGIAMLSLGADLASSSTVVAGALVLVSGLIITAVGYEKIVQRGDRLIAVRNPLVGIVVGLSMMALGAVWLAVSWNNLTSGTAIDKVSGVGTPVVILVMGLLFALAGWRRRRTLQGTMRHDIGG